MARAWHLKSRPKGEPVIGDFELKALPDQALADGEIRVRNLWLSVDPYMRGRMNDVKSYVPPFQIGEPMTGGAVGEVIESRNSGFAVGDKVLHMAGWRDEAIVVPETIDAIRALTGTVTDSAASIRLTDNTPGMRHDFLAAERS